MPERELLSLLQAPVSTGFNPSDEWATENLWAMEMGLAGWQSRRKYLPENAQDLRKLLDEKNENPLFEIVAAHSLWLSRTPNFELLRILHRHFKLRLRDHPDVVALEAHARVRGLWKRKDAPGMPRLFWPPMFSASYRLIGASPTLIDPDTLAGTVSGRLVGSPVWMCWYAPGRMPDSKALTSDLSTREPDKDQAEILGTWLAGSMQSLVGLSYLGATLQVLVRAPKTGPRMARKVWRRFSEIRDPVIQSLLRAILDQFQSAWERRSLGQFRVISLASLAARLEIPQEVVCARVQKALQPLVSQWPPSRPAEFVKSPQVQYWLEEIVMSEATAQAEPFDLSTIFLSVWEWLTSQAVWKMIEAGEFATETQFRDFLTQAVQKAVGLDRANKLKPGTAFTLDATG